MIADIKYRGLTSFCEGAKSLMMVSALAINNTVMAQVKERFDQMAKGF